MIHKISKFQGNFFWLSLLFLVQGGLFFNWTVEASCSKIFTDLKKDFKDVRTLNIVLGSFHKKTSMESNRFLLDERVVLSADSAVVFLQDVVSLSTAEQEIFTRNLGSIQETLFEQNNQPEKFYVLHGANGSLFSPINHPNDIASKSFFQSLKDKIFSSKNPSSGRENESKNHFDLNEIGDAQAIQRLSQFSRAGEVENINIFLTKGGSVSHSSLIKVLSWLHPQPSSKFKVRIKLLVDLSEGEKLFGDSGMILLLLGNELQQLYPRLKIELRDAKSGLDLKSDLESLEKIKEKLLEVMIRTKLAELGENRVEVEKYFERYMRSLIDNVFGEVAENRRALRALEVALSHESLAKLHTASPLDKILSSALERDAHFLPESFEVLSSRIHADPKVLSQEMERFRDETVKFEKNLDNASGAIYRRNMVLIRQKIRN